jgi:hypothetical protein
MSSTFMSEKSSHATQHDDAKFEILNDPIVQLLSEIHCVPVSRSLLSLLTGAPRRGAMTRSAQPSRRRN